MDYFSGIESVFLKGFSYQEKQSLFSLPWKLAAFQEMPQGDFVFFLLTGKIKDRTRYYFPGSNLLGVLPFVTQQVPQYDNAGESKVLYLRTDELANFFIHQPGAMRAYLAMQENLGGNLLPDWNVRSDLTLVISDAESSESVFFAWKLALEKSGKGKERVLYLEAVPSGISIFSMNGILQMPAVVQAKEESATIEDILDDRIVRNPGKPDVLNLHYLSPWQITPAQWGVLYQLLNTRYEAIIIHAGKDFPSFFYEQVNRIYFFNDRDAGECFHGVMKQPKTYFPPIIRLFFSEAKVVGNIIRHPRISAMPSIAESDAPQYSEWFRKNILAASNNRNFLIFGDSYGNLAGLIAVLKKLSDESGFPGWIQNHHIVAKGWSAFMIALAATSKTWEDLVQKLNRYDAKAFAKLFKPVFPENGFFDMKPIAKYFDTLFGDAMLETAGITFSLRMPGGNSVRLVSSGKIAEVLLYAVFPAGLLNGSSCPELHGYSASVEKNADDEFAFSLRYGFERFVYYYFDKPGPRDTDSLAEKILGARETIQLTPGSTNWIFHVPYANQGDLWLSQAEILNSLS